MKKLLLLLLLVPMFSQSMDESPKSAAGIGVVVGVLANQIVTKNEAKKYTNKEIALDCLLQGSIIGIEVLSCYLSAIMEKNKVIPLVIGQSCNLALLFARKSISVDDMFMSKIATNQPYRLAKKEESLVALYDKKWQADQEKDLAQTNFIQAIKGFDSDSSCSDDENYIPFEQEQSNQSGQASARKRYSIYN